MTRWTAVGLVTAAVVAGVAVSWLLYPTPLSNREAEVPNLRGLTLETAAAQLSAVGLRARTAGRARDPEVAEGAVAWQVPAAGTVLPESALVRLTISDGPPTVLVPDLARLDIGTALTVLGAAGLRAGVVDSQRTSQPVGIVVQSDPLPGKAIRAGTAISLTVSAGPGSRSR